MAFSIPKEKEDNISPSVSNEKAVALEDITSSPIEETSAPPYSEREDGITEKDDADKVPVIVTGADAAAYLVPLRDDGDAALTFRGMVLATCLSGFQATMYQMGDLFVQPLQMLRLEANNLL